MRVIRIGIFETNSSSTHSLTIGNNRGYYNNDLLLEHDGNIVIFPGEFGWETASYNDVETKASYCLTYAKQIGGEELVEMLGRVMSETTGKAVVFKESGGDYHPWGYIDHQSEDVAGPAFASDEILRRFVFGHDSVLTTGNDNED